MGHTIVPAAEEILDQEFKVLDQGFVRLVDYMGGDERIAQAARRGRRAQVQGGCQETNVQRIDFIAI